MLGGRLDLLKPDRDELNFSASRLTLESDGPPLMALRTPPIFRRSVLLETTASLVVVVVVVVQFGLRFVVFDMSSPESVSITIGGISRVIMVINDTVTNEKINKYQSYYLFILN